MATRKTITQAAVQAAKPRDKRYELRCAKITGFVLRVEPNGRRAYMVNPARGQWRSIGNADVLTLEQARTKARELLSKVAAGGPLKEPMPDGLTLRRFFDDDYKPRELKHRTTGIATEKRLRYVWATLLDEPMAGLTVDRVDRLRARMRDDGLKPQTINRDVTILRSVLSKAVAWGFLDRHPLARLKPLQEVGGKRVRYLEPDERARLLGALAHHPAYLRVIVQIALNTGLRRGEIFSLKWSDADLDRRQIRILASKTGTERYVPINSILLPILKDWKAGPRPISGLVVASPVTGRRFDNVSKAWRALVKVAAVEDFTFHDMRHDFASQLVMSGEGLYAVAKLLGHSTVAMTERYSHLAPDHLAAAVERLVTPGS